MNDIVLVSSVGDIWLDTTTARKVAQAMQKGSVYVTIAGNIIATNSIRGLLQPALYKTQAVNNRRNWVCRRGSSHAFNDNCTCKDPQKADLEKPALAEANPLTPEQQADKDLRTAAQVAWIKKCRGNWKAAAVKSDRDKFVKDYVKNNGKSIDRT